MIKGKVDPGHGGSDRSNVGKNGYIEADGNLKTAKYLKVELEKTNQFQIDLTRDIDKTLSLTERGNSAKGYDLFISQHSNAGGGSGVEVFYSVDIPKDKVFAEKLSKAISEALGIPNRGAKIKESKKYLGEDYYTVLDIAQDIGCPHVFIVESAFHDNITEEALLLKDENLLKIAQAEAKVICEFYCIGKTLIRGASKSTAEQMQIYLEKVNTTLLSKYKDIASIYAKYCEIYNIRTDLAFAQMLKETNYLRFTGTVSQEQNNFAGIGTTSSTNKGHYFPTVEEGVEAHIQHLFAYCCKDTLTRKLVDPRFNLVTRGIAPNIEDLNGRWAVPGTTYGQDIARMSETISAIKVELKPVIDYEKAISEQTMEITKLKFDVIMLQNKLNQIKTILG